MIPAWVSLPAPGEQVEFDTGHGEYTLVGGDRADVWLIVGVHGTGLLDAFTAELSRDERGFSLQEVKPEVAIRFAEEPDWRAPLEAVFYLELASERERLAHPDQ